MEEKRYSRVSLEVHGKVQGVGYRSFTIRHARQRGLTGWVRNTERNTVEIVAEGVASDLDDFISRLRKGPSASRVTEVTTHWSEASREFTDFDVYV